MKSASSLRDLESLGIFPLTGEADNLCFRCLCDLNHEGLRIMQELYGAKTFAENYNSSRGAVASAMIPYWAYREIAIIGYSLRGMTCLMTKNAVYAIEPGDEFRPPVYEDVYDEGGNWTDVKKVKDYQIQGMDWPSSYGTIDRVFSKSDHPHVGTRNVHAMSGRVT
jgi:hypothetical protein